MNMATFLPELMNAQMAAGLIFAMKKAKPKIDIRKETGLRNTIAGVLTLDEIYFAYPQNPTQGVLQGLKAAVTSGKTLALVGPSGCGKSTAIALINRFYDPVDGKVVGSEFKIRLTILNCYEFSLSQFFYAISRKQISLFLQYFSGNRLSKYSSISLEIYSKSNGDSWPRTSAIQLQYSGEYLLWK